MDMNSMFGKIQEMQQKMREVQENVEKLTATAEAGAGMVKATVNGKKQVVNIEIDPDVISKDDREMLEDLTVAAINKALEKVDALVKEEMQKQTAGFMPNIPGFDLNNMM